MPTVIRVKWPGGYVDVPQSPGPGLRRTIPFDAGNVRTREAAIEVGQSVLAEQGDRPQRSWAAQVGDTPEWPSTGDRVSTVGIDGTTLEDNRIASRRVSITNTGFAQLEPTLASKQTLFVERNQLALRKLTSGQVGGRSSAGEPLQIVDSNVFTGQMSEPSLGPFSWSKMTAGPPSAVPIKEPMIITRMTVLTTTPTGGPPGPNGEATPKLEGVGQPWKIVWQKLSPLNGDQTVVFTIPLYQNSGFTWFEYTFIGIALLVPDDKLSLSLGIDDLSYVDANNHSVSITFQTAIGNFVQDQQKMTPELR